jgi:hypothetical protein
MVKVIQEGQWFKSSHAGLGCHAVNSSTLSPIDYVRPHNCEKYISEELRKKEEMESKKQKKRRWTARLKFDSWTSKWCQIKNVFKNCNLYKHLN